MEKIVSLQNPRVKNAIRLSQKARERKSQDLFVFEGARELSLALEGGYRIDSIFICSELFAATEYPDVLQKVDERILIEVSALVFEKIAYREGSDGLFVMARPGMHNLADLPLPENPFIIVLEAVEKPGNLGAILRTADAAGADALIICDPLVDLYNPNVIRSSVGCLFTVPVAVAGNADAYMFFENKKIKTFAAELTADNWYQDIDFTGSSAVVMGTEADGLTNFWLEHADARIKIPMRGKIDSLNVSVSTAILTFEAMRQRGF